MKTIILLMTLTISILANDVKFYNPSFDCTKVKEKSIEYKICTDEKLATLDIKLSKLYKSVKEKYGKYTIKYNQIDWLKQRNKCKNINCMTKAYEDRVAFLTDLDNSVTLGKPIKRDVWDFELTKNVGSLDFYTANSNGDVVISYTDRYSAHDEGNFYVNYLFLDKKFSFKFGEIISDIVTDFTSIDLSSDNSLFQDGPITVFSDKTVLKIKNFQLFGGGYSKRCIPYYGDSYNFQLEDSKGNILAKKMLLVRLDEPIKFHVDKYCENTGFEIMHTAIWHVPPTFLRILGDDTFLVTPRYLDMKDNGLSDAIYNDDVIRFDKNLNTKSKLMGKKFFWIDMDEYAKVVGHPKSLKDENIALQAWIDKKLEKEEE